MYRVRKALSSLAPKREKHGYLDCIDNDKPSSLQSEKGIAWVLYFSWAIDSTFKMPQESLGHFLFGAHRYFIGPQSSCFDFFGFAKLCQDSKLATALHEVDLDLRNGYCLEKTPSALLPKYILVNNNKISIIQHLVWLVWLEARLIKCVTVQQLLARFRSNLCVKMLSMSYEFEGHQY